MEGEKICFGSFTYFIWFYALHVLGNFIEILCYQTMMWILLHRNI